MRAMKNAGIRHTDYRRAQTRTKIQLGGLIIKSRLAEVFGLELGQDLQQDDEIFDEVAALLGALVELKSSMDLDTLPQQKMLWAQKGKVCLAQN